MSDRALVLGLGDSGLAMARFLESRGYAVRVADTRPEPPQLAALSTEMPQVEFVAATLSQPCSTTCSCWR